MNWRSKENHLLFLLIVGLSAWVVPGAGYYLLNEKKRAIIVFVTIVLTFCIGIYVGSIGVIDPISSGIPYAGQIMNSPFVAVLAHKTAGGNYPVYSKPNEIGQIYTSISGLLNLLCIINSIYLAHLKKIETAGE